MWHWLRSLNHLYLPCTEKCKKSFADMFGCSFYLKPHILSQTCQAFFSSVFFSFSNTIFFTARWLASLERDSRTCQTSYGLCLEEAQHHFRYSLLIKLQGQSRCKGREKGTASLLLQSMNKVTRTIQMQGEGKQTLHQAFDGYNSMCVEEGKN